MKKGVVVGALSTVIGLVSMASVANASGAGTRALTALEDARACAPLARGGYAVATGGGLAIVDGKDGSVKSMTSLDGLPDTRVHAVVESADGLWVGTEGGAALVNVAALSVARTVGDESVHAIVTTASNGIFLGTWGRGVFRLNDKSSSPVLVPTTGGTVGKHVAAIGEHAGAVHVAYSDGPVTRFENGALRVVNGTPTHGQAIGSFGTRLVFADIEGLFRVNDDASLLSLSTVDARGLVGADRLYVATYGSGLLASTSPTGAALRAEAGVPRWVKGVGVRGTSRCAATTEGLFVSEGAAAWHKVSLGQGPQSNDVTTLAVNDDKQRVLIGTFDHGASVSTNGGSSFQRVQGLEPTETVNASVWQGNTLWLGTAHGLVRVDGTSLSATHRVRAADGLPSSIVRAVLVLSKDRLLVGTEEGAALIDVAHNDRPTPLITATTKKKGTRETLASPMHATWSLAQGADGTIYLGTASGLYWGKIGDETFERASLSSSDLKDDWVTALAIKGNTLYAGTYSGGVSKITFESATKHTSTHLGGGYVNPDGLMIAGNDLYASTMDNLLVRALSDADTTKWQTRSNASTGKDVTSARFVGTSLWVSSRRGISVVSP